MIGELVGFRPKENVRPAARREKTDWEGAIVGKGVLSESLMFVNESSSGVMSFDDGRVEEELKRADDEELS